MRWGPEAMTETPTMDANLESGATFGGPMTRFFLGRVARALSNSPVAFDIRLPDGSVQYFGQGVPSCHVSANSSKGVRALASLDQIRIGDAYLAGDIDIDGD